MSAVFADSSGLIAAFDARDPRHAVAAGAWRDLAAAGSRLVLTQLVLAETVTYLRRRAGFEPSRRAGDALLASANVEVVALDAERIAAAWRELVRSPDPKLSLCDVASFVVMRERGIARALTFDRHFAAAGFEVLGAVL